MGIVCVKKKDFRKRINLASVSSYMLSKHAYVAIMGRNFEDESRPGKQWIHYLLREVVCKLRVLISPATSFSTFILS